MRDFHNLSIVEMGKIIDRQRSVRRCSTTIRCISLIFVILILTVLLESVCLGILYVKESLNSEDNSSFANEHLLTRLFVSAPAVPPGLPPRVHFLGYGLTRLYAPDNLLGYRLPAASSVVQ